MFLRETTKEFQEEWAQYDGWWLKVTKYWFTDDGVILTSQAIPQYIKDTANMWMDSEFKYAIDLQTFINATIGEQNNEYK